MSFSWFASFAWDVLGDPAALAGLPRLVCAGFETHTTLWHRRLSQVPHEGMDHSIRMVTPPRRLPAAQLAGVLFGEFPRAPGPDWLFFGGL